jgi:hypothetical protein
MGPVVRGDTYVPVLRKAPERAAGRSGGMPGRCTTGRGRAANDRAPRSPGRTGASDQVISESVPGVRVATAGGRAGTASQFARNVPIGPTAHPTRRSENPFQTFGRRLPPGELRRIAIRKERPLDALNRPWFSLAERRWMPPPHLPASALTIAGSMAREAESRQIKQKWKRMVSQVGGHLEKAAAEGEPARTR